MQICFLLKTLQKFLKIKKSVKVKKMKAMRIIISIAFVFISIATLTVFISEKINTDKTIPQIKVEEEVIEVSLKATDEELLKGVTAHDEKDGDLTEKIIVELKSKVGGASLNFDMTDSGGVLPDLLAALESLGYRRMDIVDMAQKLVSNNPDKDVAKLVPMALKEISGNK